MLIKRIERMKEINEFVVSKVDEERDKLREEQKRNGLDVNKLKVGQEVYIRRGERKSRLDPLADGPFIITKALSNSIYVREKQGSISLDRVIVPF